MNQRAIGFLLRNKKLLFLLGGVLIYGTLIAYAVPPSSAYNPGETLDPACAPGDTNCTVNTVVISSVFGRTGTITAQNGDYTTAQVTESGNLYFTNTRARNAISLTTTGSSGAATYDSGTGVLNIPQYTDTNTDSQDLQDVTDEGNTTTNNLISSAGVTAQSPGSGTDVSVAATAANTNSVQLNILSDEPVITFNTGSGLIGLELRAANITGSKTLQFPNVSGTLAEGITDGVTTVHAGSDGIVDISSLLSGLGGSGITLKTDGVDNGSQSVLNLVAGSNISLSDNGTGDITITAVAGSGSSPISIGTSGNTLYSSGLTGTGQGNTSIGGNIFLGTNAGNSATGAGGSTFLGYYAGDSATNAANAIFIGPFSGQYASEAIASNFFGSNAGQGATNASNSNFFGWNAGLGASGAYNSNFFGNSAGNGASAAIGSNFLGPSAGDGATNATSSNFLGVSAGDNAEDASYSNFFGWNSGQNATDAEHSNFFGVNSGQNATDASYSNFFGSNAGSGATSATNSNFLGQKAGWNAGVASYSNIFGFHAGYTYTGNDIGSNNIIIGTNISLPNATANAINIGGVLFGTGTYIDTDASHNPSITAQTAGKIGIARIPTTYTLEVGNSSVSGIVARFVNSTGTCDINPTSASLSCSSDRTLKKNITTLDSGRDASDILNKVLSLRPVTYNWKSETDTTGAHIGFIAQDVREVFPDLVSQDEQTQLLSLNYMGLIPYTVRALQEMHLQIQQLPTFSDQSLMQKVADFLRGIAENATAIVDTLQSKRVQTDQLCVGSICITEQQFLDLLHQQPTGSSGGAPVIDDTTHDEDTANTEGDETTPPSTEDASSESTPDESSDSTETQTTPSDPITEPQTTNSTATEPTETQKNDSAASESSTSAESSDSNSKGESSSEVPSTVAQ